MSLETIRRVLEQEANAIMALHDRLGDSFLTAIEWIERCPGRVITCGVGKSGHIARKISGTLSSTGTPSLFLHATEAVHGDLGMVTQSDVVLMFTYSGETDELVRLFPSIHSIGAKTIALTGRADSSVGRLANLWVDCHVESEACPNGLAPTTSTTLMLAVGDALAVAVMERRGFTKEDFAKFHPSGTLGKRLLLRVRDVMRKGSDMAVLGPESLVLDISRAITEAGVGAACIVSQEMTLLGFISEGDLRRNFVNRPDPLAATGKDLMTASPQTIEPDLLAVDALEAFQNFPKAIGEMPVVENGRVVGLLMLKDLLRSGIV